MLINRHYLKNVRIPSLILIVMLMAACQAEKPDSLLSVVSDDPITSHGQAIKDKFIVILKPEAITHPLLQPLGKFDSEIDPISARAGLSVIDFEERHKAMRQEAAFILKENRIPYDRIREVFSGETKGMMIEVGETELISRLRKDPRVAVVEPDRIIALDYSPLIKTPMVPSGGGGSQKAPYGLNKVGGSKDQSSSTKRAWIVDTGIDLDHEDLNVDVEMGANFTTDPNMDDGNGHGTHVAGIIGAIDNSIGIKGVAAGVKVVPVKVLTNEGYGSTSSVINGLSYIASLSSSKDVVNISLGGIASGAIDQAVLDIAGRGTRVFIAAGNEYQDLSNSSPARVNGSRIYTIAASDENDKFASFSNYGSGVDYMAPGVGILSTYKNNQYGYLSGTSMAAPHIAGLFLNSTDIEGGVSITMPNGQTRRIPGIDD